MRSKQRFNCPIAGVLAALTLDASIYAARAQEGDALDPKPLPPLAHPNNPATPEKETFGRETAPSSMPARAIGFYSRGRLAGAQALPVNGATWQATRISRDRSWSHKIRPYWGHKYQFRVRFSCPQGDSACREQRPVPLGEGCEAASLAFWFKPSVGRARISRRSKPRRALTMASLPSERRKVLLAEQEAPDLQMHHDFAGLRLEPADPILSPGRAL